MRLSRQHISSASPQYGHAIIVDLGADLFFGRRQNKTRLWTSRYKQSSLTSLTDEAEWVHNFIPKPVAIEEMADPTVFSGKPRRNGDF